MLDFFLTIVLPYSMAAVAGVLAVRADRSLLHKRLPLTVFYCACFLLALILGLMQTASNARDHAEETKAAQIERTQNETYRTYEKDKFQLISGALDIIAKNSDPHQTALLFQGVLNPLLRGHSTSERAPVRDIMTAAQLDDLRNSAFALCGQISSSSNEHNLYVGALRKDIRDRYNDTAGRNKEQAETARRTQTADLTRTESAYKTILSLQMAGVRLLLPKLYEAVPQHGDLSPAAAQLLLTGEGNISAVQELVDHVREVANRIPAPS
jgi:hypothetical protein